MKLHDRATRYLAQPLYGDGGLFDWCHGAGLRARFLTYERHRAEDDSRAAQRLVTACMSANRSVG
jgi:hypothetical protein